MGFRSPAGPEAPAVLLRPGPGLRSSGLQCGALRGADPETHSDFPPWILKVLLFDLVWFFFGSFSLLSGLGAGG